MSNETAFPPTLMPDEASPDWFNKADNAWQLTAATLVGLQSIPGLMILSGGGMKKKWAVNSAFMQLLILIAGAVLGRMNFYAWMMFMGLIDYSGGYVIHLSSGVAGYTAAYWVGPRLTKDRERFPPNNILLMLFGAGLLWMGWTGFNGGDPYVASSDASLAVLNTHLCTATSSHWVGLDIIFFPKAYVIGAAQGMITGLVCITPAAGVVDGWAAVIMGLCSGSIPWTTMMVIHKHSEILQKVDDTMAGLHTHAIAGSLGGILTGLFAKPNLNKLFFGDSAHYIGLFYGFDDKSRIGSGVRQMGVQFAGIMFVVFVNVLTTTIICLSIQMVVPLRMSDEDVEIGDDAAHCEEAYAIWGSGDRHENSFYPSSVNAAFELPVTTN
ncbi:hypothetical protein H0E87_011803 [Populus deltoides]|uniref:Ammonium transporter AmtB-like domain-containing protein n=1 Tax=Populus deltoides TaxID=3696 RepID=A0A8T2YGG6_POPDE|nr:hypothetical protein H0E87_011803 [Populus deltoides]